MARNWIAPVVKYIFYESDEILHANSHARTHVHINNFIPFQCYVTKQLLPEWLALIYEEDFLMSCLLFNLIMFSIKVMRFCTPTRMHARTHAWMHTSIILCPFCQSLSIYRLLLFLSNQYSDFIIRNHKSFIHKQNPNVPIHILIHVETGERLL